MEIWDSFHINGKHRIFTDCKIETTTKYQICEGMGKWKVNQGKEVVVFQKDGTACEASESSGLGNMASKGGF